MAEMNNGAPEGEGLMDLTRESENTSLGAVLDELPHEEKFSGGSLSEGSGLMDMTRESDNTSLGAVLDEIADKNNSPENEPSQVENLTKEEKVSSVLNAISDKLTHLNSDDISKIEKILSETL